MRAVEGDQRAAFGGDEKRAFLPSDAHHRFVGGVPALGGVWAAEAGVFLGKEPALGPIGDLVDIGPRALPEDDAVEVCDRELSRDDRDVRLLGCRFQRVFKFRAGFWEGDEGCSSGL